MKEHIPQLSWDSVKKDDWVLVRDRNDEEWQIRRFDHYDEEEDKVYIYSEIAQYVIPFNHGLTPSLTIRDIFTQKELDRYEGSNPKPPRVLS